MFPRLSSLTGWNTWRGVTCRRRGGKADRHSCVANRHSVRKYSIRGATLMRRERPPSAREPSRTPTRQKWLAGRPQQAPGRYWRISQRGKGDKRCSPRAELKSHHLVSRLLRNGLLESWEQVAALKSFEPCRGRPRFKFAKTRRAKGGMQKRKGRGRRMTPNDGEVLRESDEANVTAGSRCSAETPESIG